MVSGLVARLAVEEQICTTLQKAKEVVSVFDRVVSLARKGQLHNRRRLAMILKCPEAEIKLFDDIAQRNLERPSGHVRIFRLGRRKGDGASMVLMRLADSNKEFVTEKSPEESKVKAISSEEKTVAEAKVEKTTSQKKIVKESKQSEEVVEEAVVVEEVEEATIEKATEGAVEESSEEGQTTQDQEKTSSE